MSIAASLVVQFGQSADSTALVKMEWDEVLNIDSASEEKQQFSPGDDAYFFIHHDTSKLRIGRVAVTHGQVVKQTIISRERSQQLLFAEAGDCLEIDYIPSGSLAAKWYMAAGVAQIIKRTARKVKAEGTPFPALAEVTYPISAQGYKLKTPTVSLTEGEDYPITVVAWMEAVA